MLDGSSPEASRPIDAVRIEVLAARVLLAAQVAVEAAMTRGARAEELQPELKALREAIEAARQASIERRRYFPTPGSLEAWLETAPPAETPLALKLAGEARTLRREIEETAQRCAYIARRTVGWYEAQLASLAEWVASAAVPGGDYAPRESQLPHEPISIALDRAA